MTSEIPEGAVQGGYDSSGNPLYVGSLIHLGYDIPAKVSPKDGRAYIVYDRREYSSKNYWVKILDY